MGQLLSKKPKLEINEVDRAVLSLKSQVRKLEQQRTRIQAAIDREHQLARELVAAGRKDRALLALKKRKLQETQAASLDGLLLNVEQMLANIETTQSQQRIFGALKQANSAVKEMQQAVPLEDVEQLMQDNADAKAYEDSLRQMLGESLNPEDAEAAEEELADLEAQLLDAQKLDMPQAPKDTVLPEAAAAVAAEEAAPAWTAEEAAPAGGEQALSALGGAAAASEADALSAAEAMLSELPAVPTTTVTVETEEAEVEAEQEREAESALIAA